MPISQQLREAIAKSGLSLHQIARATGVTQPALTKFMSGDPTRDDIRLVRTADKLAVFFDLELTAKKVGLRQHQVTASNSTPSRRSTKKKRAARK